MRALPTGIGTYFDEDVSTRRNVEILHTYYSGLLFMISRNVEFLQQIQSKKCFLNIIN